MIKPISYSRRGKKITYHYKFKDLKEFLTHGKKEGNNGMILVGEDEDFYIYKGFGTIENPWKYVLTCSMQHDPVYDGKRRSPMDYIRSFDKKQEDPNISHSITILNFGEDE